MMSYFWGKVQRGKQRGKTLGFPTANIGLHQKIPQGVYLSQTKVGKQWLPSLTFIGNATTFGEKEYKAETYILSFNKSMYHQWISIKLLKKIRGNKKFATIDLLTLQMKRDKKTAKKFFMMP